MDAARADFYKRLFIGKTIDRWRVSRLLGNGKSAVVFVGESDAREYALKVFDPEIAERYGVVLQEQRLQNELSLSAHGIPNLIGIIGGGKCTIESQEYFYIVMPLVRGMTLREYIRSSECGQAFIVQVLTTLLDISERLLERKIAHRDIKPDNIMASPSGELTLMDLGVVKLVGSGSLTDVDAKQFVGTQRYAPPEFLLRDEQDTQGGWRAVNLYQIGATLHDLIMKKELFAEKNPQAALVKAVLEEYPFIENAKVDRRLIQLARDLLDKNWTHRLALAPIERIREVISSLAVPPVGVEASYEKARQMQAATRTKLDEIASLRATAEEKDAKLKGMLDELRRRTALALEKTKAGFGLSEVKNLGTFRLQNTRLEHFERRLNALYLLSDASTTTFLRPTFYLIQSEIDFEMNCSFRVSAILPTRFMDLANLVRASTPWAVLQEQLLREIPSSPRRVGASPSPGMKIFLFPVVSRRCFL